MNQDELIAMGIAPEAIERVMELYGADIARSAGEAEGWRERCRILEAQGAERDYRRAADEAAGALRFSSKSARRAFLAALGETRLPLEGESFAGAEYRAFLDEYRGADPQAFEGESPAPRFVGPTPGAGSAPPDGRERANAAFREAVRK